MCGLFSLNDVFEIYLCYSICDMYHSFFISFFFFFLVVFNRMRHSISLSIHQSTGIWFLPRFVVKDNSALTIHVHVIAWAYGSVSFGYTLRSGIPGSYGNSMFNLLRNYQLFSKKTVPCYVPTGKVPISVPPHRHFLFSIWR